VLTHAWDVKANNITTLVVTYFGFAGSGNSISCVTGNHVIGKQGAKQNSSQNEIKRNAHDVLQKRKSEIAFDLSWICRSMKKGLPGGQAFWGLIEVEALGTTLFVPTVPANQNRVARANTITFVVKTNLHR
jgi:hypothetical protein